jgi:hypothetical protein
LKAVLQNPTKNKEGNPEGTTHTSNNGAQSAMITKEHRHRTMNKQAFNAFVNNRAFWNFHANDTPIKWQHKIIFLYQQRSRMV